VVGTTDNGDALESESEPEPDQLNVFGGRRDRQIRDRDTNHGWPDVVGCRPHMALAALGSLAEWPVEAAAIAVVRGGSVLDVAGDQDRSYPWASVTKLITAAAVLLCVDDGLLDLDEPAGPPGSTARHLLAHASGLEFDSGTVRRPPGERRIYSNAGYEQLGQLVSDRSGKPFAEVATSRVLAPLGAIGSHIAGSPASGAQGPLRDLARLAAELNQPRVFSASVVSRMSTVAFPGLPGLLPGIGFQATNDWGLGAEIRDSKEPHWTGAANSSSTFGHFGASGSFLWVDPDRDLACACLTGTQFGPWALRCWPPMADAMLAELS
jgi:CubicO group peptidase (beta-lactamase class C family)